MKGGPAVSLGYIAKALIGALIAFVSVLVTAAESHGITLQEWLTAALAALVALGGVYVVPNSRRAQRGL